MKVYKIYFHGKLLDILTDENISGRRYSLPFDSDLDYEERAYLSNSIYEYNTLNEKLCNYCIKSLIENKIISEVIDEENLLNTLKDFNIFNKLSNIGISYNIVLKNTKQVFITLYVSKHFSLELPFEDEHISIIPNNIE